jgi:hypothetical protein
MGGHELQARPLPRREAAGAGVEKLVAGDGDQGRAPFHVHRPVDRAVDPAADDVAELDGDEVDGIVERTGDVAALSCGES